MRTARIFALGALGASTLFAACGVSLDPPPDDSADGSVDGAPADVAANLDGASDVTRDTSADASLDVNLPDSEGGSDGAPVPPTWAIDWTAIVGTGQSLSIGSQGLPVVSTTPSFSNLKLDDTGADPRFVTPTNLTLVPLVEPIRPTAFVGATAGAYPANIRGETPHTAMATQITVLARAAGLADLVTLHSVVGSGGKALSFIQKSGTGNSYDRSLYEATAFKGFATTANKRFGVGAVILTHGETDAVLPTYEAGLVALAKDYDTDLRTVTGQPGKIPLFVSQQHALPRRGDPDLRSSSTMAAWTAARDPSGLVVCLGPKYQYAYAADHLHLEAPSYRRLGIKNAEAFFRHVVTKQPFVPLQPKQVTRSGRVVRVAFDVPYPPLAWDTVLPTPHPQVGHPWALGKGFEVEDDSGKAVIERVDIVGNAVEITLVAAPAGTNLVVRYAMTMDDTGPAGNRAGEADGRLGLLRDSDPLIGIDDEILDVTVTAGSTAVTGDFTKHSRYEIVVPAVANALPSETALVSRTTTSAVLSAPWAGASGAAKIRVHSNQYNYAVAFELPVP